MKYAIEIAAGLGISALAAVGFCWLEYQDRQKTFIAAAKANTHVLWKLAESSRRKHGAFPETLATTQDPWNTPYIYAVVDNSPSVCSSGPDTHPNTQDDICAP